MNVTARREFTEIETSFAINALLSANLISDNSTRTILNVSVLYETDSDRIPTRESRPPNVPHVIQTASITSLEGVETSLDRTEMMESKLGDWELWDIEPDFRTGLEETILASLDFSPGWDGYEGVVPTQDAANNAIHFIQLLPSGIEPPRPLIAGDGEIGVYWKRGDAYIEAASYGGTKIEYFARDGDRNLISSGSIDFVQNRLPELLLKAIENFSGLP